MNDVVTLRWINQSPDSSVAILYANANKLCYVIGDGLRGRDQKVAGETRLHNGDYHMILEYSPKFSPKYGHNMVTVVGDTGFVGIRMHKGVTKDHTEGCLITVTDITLKNSNFEGVAGSSQKAYDIAYKVISDLIAKNGGKVRFLVRSGIESL